MIYRKLIFLSLFVFSSNFLFSQILEQNDADIFIENFENIFEKIKEIDNYNDNVNNYHVLLEELSQSFTEIIFDIMNGDVLTNDRFNKIKRQYQQYLEIDVQEEIDEIYRSMGFSNNGHKKFFVIMWGLYVWAFWADTENEEIAKLMKLFDENDVEIIKNSIEKYDF